MEQFIGFSKSGNVQEAAKGLQNPKLIIILSGDKDKFGEQVSSLAQLYPEVPSIGCVGQSYSGKNVLEQGVTITAFCGNIAATANILTEVDKMPVKSIRHVEDDMKKIGGDAEHTVCIDLCAANDECVLTTLQSVLSQKRIQLTGGTAWEGTVCCNGTVYQNACAYTLIRNQGGKVKVYKENLYIPTDKAFIVTKAEPSKNMLCELDGRPAESVYCSELQITPDKVETQTFQNPFGRMIGEDVYIVSIKEKSANQSLICFRKTYPKDKLNILQMGDYDSIVEETIQNIQKDFRKISGIFAINCLFRYLYFKEQKYVDQYFLKMSQLGPYSGLIGLGEHYNAQHTNQTMSCVVFE